MENAKPESDTPRYDSVQNWAEARDLCKQLERELKTTQAALDQMTADCVKLASQLDRSISISDGMMAWETMQDTRNSMKDLSQLKKEIKEK